MAAEHPIPVDGHGICDADLLFVVQLHGLEQPGFGRASRRRIDVMAEAGIVPGAAAARGEAFVSLDLYLL